MLRIISLSQVQELHENIDEVTLARITSGQVERLECLDGFDLIAFDWYDIFAQSSEPAQVLIYFSEQDLFFICENAKCLKMVKEKTNELDTTEKTIAAFFVELMKPDMDYLEKLEDEIGLLEDELILKSHTECARDLIGFRRILTRLKKYYEQLNSIFEEFVENENNLISAEHLRYFKVLDNRVDRLFSSVKHLRDYVSQVREAYQAQVDIEQNKLMKVFTVITSIFLPLTLIVGWYGMNLKMPEFDWDYGYTMVIILSSAVFVFSMLMFKIKKWF
ncbi:MAG: CorA family divalent cation transporter [Clostridia bacterium]